MNIKDVKTAIKVGDFVLRKNNSNKIDIRYLSNLNKKILTDNSASGFSRKKVRILSKQTANL